ncbi:MAG: Fe-S protein assembly co-chaperone HscB [Halieaceae bacterium]|nr:Fe-S protein assembly co-chaperone HscB [Halieaceae bacterium]MDG2411119.1 Fe-S protein assembly co-chaperone HscB [Halioglobus sp.]
MSEAEFQRNYFDLFDLPIDFTVDQQQLGARYRQAQGELHPDRYAGASAHEQRLAVQYSALVNQAYATLRTPLSRAIYLLELRGISQQELTSQPVDGGFLMMQMELREKLETSMDLVDPEPVLEHLIAEISQDIAAEQARFGGSWSAGDLPRASSACVKMQYLDKLLREAEQTEANLLEN